MVDHASGMSLPRASRKRNTITGLYPNNHEHAISRTAVVYISPIISAIRSLFALSLPERHGP